MERPVAVVKKMSGGIAILAMVCSAIVTLFAIVFCLGMGANAKPHEIRALKMWMLGLTLIGVVGIAVGLFLLRAGQSGLAAKVSFAPAAIVLVIFIIALNK